jgi:hypothetical protein
MFYGLHMEDFLHDATTPQYLYGYSKLDVSYVTVEAQTLGCRTMVKNRFRWLILRDCESQDSGSNSTLSLLKVFIAHYILQSLFIIHLLEKVARRIQISKVLQNKSLLKKVITAKLAGQICRE